MAVGLSYISFLPSTDSAPSWNSSSPLMQRKQRALARAAFADDGNDLALRHLQVDALEHFVWRHTICAGR
jgi:hypothetical protein